MPVRDDSAGLPAHAAQILDGSRVIYRRLVMWHPSTAMCRLWFCGAANNWTDTCSVCPLAVDSSYSHRFVNCGTTASTSVPTEVLR